jgi:Na+/phosphate symporter
MRVEHPVSESAEALITRRVSLELSRSKRNNQKEAMLLLPFQAKLLASMQKLLKAHQRGIHLTQDLLGRVKVAMAHALKEVSLSVVVIEPVVASVHPEILKNKNHLKLIHYWLRKVMRSLPL